MRDDKYNKFLKDIHNPKYVEELYKKNPKNLQYKFMYGRQLLKTNPDEGKKILIQLLGTKNENYALLELARLEFKYRNYDLAYNYYSKLLKIAKNDVDTQIALNGLGKCLIKFKEFKKAEKFFIDLKQSGDRITAIYWLGVIAEKEGNFEEAKKYYNELKKYSDKNHAILGLGRIAEKEGKFEEARKYYKSVLNVENTRRYALTYLSRLEYKDNNKEQSLYNINKCFEMKKSEYGYDQLLFYYFKEKKFKSCLKYIKEGLKNNYEINPKLLMYMCKKYNIFFDIDYSKIKYNYSLNQALDYDEYIALEHVIERHVNNENEEINFNKDIDVYKLFNEIKVNLNKNTKINKLIFFDTYVVPYENASQGCNYIKVLTIPFTKNIITMYPVKNIYDLDEEEENDISEEKSNNEVNNNQYKRKK